jgi:A/G-specific adenine glycosylase
MILMNKKEVNFCDTVLNYYRSSGRHDLPWRKNQTPYRVLVSELMLQQTQVERVVPKYQNFITIFPDVEALAVVQLGDVLKQWQGLGYNRRAKFLHETAKKVKADFNGVFPDTFEGLMLLPGIGPYTAGAVLAFAHNQPVPIIETNIRQVYLHHFFVGKSDVPDADILQMVVKTLSDQNPREWYAALMDYGSYLKQQHGNLNTRSKHYSKQSVFAGSDRQIRGAIIATLTRVSTPISVANLYKVLPNFDRVRLEKQLSNLEIEEFVKRQGAKYLLK